MTTVLYAFAALAALGALAMLYLAALALWAHTARIADQVHRLAYDRRIRDLDAQQREMDVTRLVYPGDGGTFPLLVLGRTVLDAGRGCVFTLTEGTQSVTPVLARPEQLARILRSAGGWPPGDAAGELLSEPAREPAWPTRVPLSGILDGPPSVRSLVLGVTIKADGTSEVVRADMQKLVHVAIGGSSGWGKSVFMRALAYQLALSDLPVDLALVDLEAATFAPFTRCERLLWPIADTEQDALAVFNELISEMNRRRELYTAYPGIDSLWAYNARASEPLSPIICLVDEAAVLLSNRDMESTVRTLALRSRKYGVWLIAASQDWKATSLDTSIRNQISSRFQFKAMSASQSRVLLQQSGAEELEVEGRALAILPGRPLTMLQAPFISHNAIMQAVNNGGPRNAMPSAPIGDDGGADADQAARIRELHEEGASDTRIAREVFGYGNPFYIEKVRQVLRQQQQWDDGNGPPGAV